MHLRIWFFFFFLNYFLITLSPDSLLRLHLLSGWVQNCLTLTPPVEASSLESMGAELLDLDPTCWGFISWADGCRIALPWPHLLRLHLLSRWVQNCLTLTPPVEASSLEPMAALLHYLDSTCSDFISWADGCRIAWPWPHLCSFLDPHSPLKMCTITSTTGTQKQKVCFRLVSHVFLALWFVVGCHMATELHVSFRVIHWASDDLSSPQQLKLYHVICFI